MKKLGMLVLVALSLFGLVGCGSDSLADDFTANNNPAVEMAGLSMENPAVEAPKVDVAVESSAVEEAVVNDDAMVAENLKEFDAIMGEQEKVAETEVTPVADGVISIGIGETLTIQVVAKTEKPFASFGTAIVFDDSKVDIISSALIAGEGFFSGFYATNLAYDPSLGNQGQVRLLWEQNHEKGLKTVFMGGVSANNIVGEVALFAITIKGVAQGETILDVQAMPKSFVNTAGQPAEFTEKLEPIAIFVQ